jgi:hypothetical protein
VTYTLAQRPSPPTPQPSIPTPSQPQLINKSISLGPYPAGDRYYLRVFNVDDVSRVKVNGRDVLSVGYYQEREIDITGYLREGQNTIELILENTGGGWTYGYVLKKGGNVIWSDSCGSVGRKGCDDNIQTKGIVARHVINLAIQQPPAPPPQQDRPRVFGEITGETRKFNNLILFLGSMDTAILGCPKERCDNPEEEAAKVLISHLLTKKVGKELGYLLLKWGIKEMILAGLDDIIKMAINVAEIKVKEKVQEIKDKINKGKDSIQYFMLGWEDIGGSAIYLPYTTRDGPYGKVDGEALVVFYSPYYLKMKKEKIHGVERAVFYSTRKKDEKEIIGPPGGWHISFYIPSGKLYEKIRQLPDDIAIRPFVLSIRGIVFEEGEVMVRERWNGTIKGPFVHFFEATESTVPAILEPENFRQINDKIFAGGRPTIEQIRWLKEKVGIKSIVNLER